MKFGKFELEWFMNRIQLNYNGNQIFRIDKYSSRDVLSIICPKCHYQLMDFTFYENSIKDTNNKHEISLEDMNHYLCCNCQEKEKEELLKKTTDKLRCRYEVYEKHGTGIISKCNKDPLNIEHCQNNCDELPECFEANRYRELDYWWTEDETDE